METKKDFKNISFLTKDLKPRKNYRGQLETLCEMPQISKLPAQENALICDPVIQFPIEQTENISTDFNESLLISSSDDRKKFDEKLWPHQMIVQLALEYDDTTYGGTGILIGPYHVLTAGHNVYSKGKWANKIYASPGRNKHNQPFGVVMAVRCYASSGWLEGENEDDLGLIVLDEPLGLLTGWAGIVALADEEIKNKKFFIAGYPGDKGFKELWGMKGNVPIIESKIMKYEIDTNGGQSGSGVCFIRQSDIYVTGIHVKGGAIPNQATRITEERLETILKWMGESFGFEETIAHMSPNQEELRDYFWKSRRGDRDALRELEKEAMNGNARALYLMACLYNEGFGVERSLNLAVKYLKATTRYGIQEYQEILSVLKSNDSIEGLVKRIEIVSPSDGSQWVIDYQVNKLGDRYEGEIVNGKQHGKGIYFFVNSSRYEGDFVDDKRHGKGIYCFANGSRYEGDFVDDKCHGKGIYCFANGSRYKGDFVDDKRHGKGILYSINKDRYEGDFVDDKRHGKGIEYFANGSRYEGDFVDDKPHGKGIYCFANGSRYEGDFVDDKCHGKGIMYYADGDRYEGGFVENNPHGKGIMYYANDDKYEGDIICGKRHGKGIMHSVNGDRYEGEYGEDKQNGKGIVYFANGNRYEGDFAENNPQGKGIYSFANGSKYEGDIICGKRHGKGIYYFTNGIRYDGEYVEDKRYGKGIYYYINKDRYEGDFVEDKLHGKGTYYYEDGDRYEGNFVANKFHGKGIFYYTNGGRYESNFFEGKRQAICIYYIINRDIFCKKPLCKMVTGVKKSLYDHGKACFKWCKI